MEPLIGCVMMLFGLLLCFLFVLLCSFLLRLFHVTGYAYENLMLLSRLSALPLLGLFYFALGKLGQNTGLRRQRKELSEIAERRRKARRQAITSPASAKRTSMRKSFNRFRKDKEQGSENDDHE